MLQRSLILKQYLVPHFQNLSLRCKLTNHLLTLLMQSFFDGSFLYLNLISQSLYGFGCLLSPLLDPRSPLSQLLGLSLMFLCCSLRLQSLKSLLLKDSINPLLKFSGELMRDPLSFELEFHSLSLESDPIHLELLAFGL
jgi:hypothetical protein